MKKPPWPTWKEPIWFLLSGVILLLITRLFFIYQDYKTKKLQVASATHVFYWPGHSFIDQLMQSLSLIAFLLILFGIICLLIMLIKKVFKIK